MLIDGRRHIEAELFADAVNLAVEPGLVISRHPVGRFQEIEFDLFGIALRKLVGLEPCPKRCLVGLEMLGNGGMVRKRVKFHLSLPQPRTPLTSRSSSL